MKFTWIIALFLWGAFYSSTKSAELPRPRGSIVLTLMGNIQSKNSSEGAEFDLKMLENIGLRTLKTSTNWTDGVKEFEGILVRDLMALVGARGRIVKASALNDYTVQIPLTDFEKYDVLLAIRMDGRDLSVRDKGPLWVVYPRDQASELRNAVVDARWIWQLRTLTIQ